MFEVTDMTRSEAVNSKQYLKTFKEFNLGNDEAISINALFRNPHLSIL